jgi:tRNA(fMet)-specific endonuclease VapC
VIERYLLDTNAANALVRRRQPFRRQSSHVHWSAIAISSVTAAEMHFGLAKRPEATSLADLVKQFLHDVAIEPWTAEIAPHYGTMRAALESKGVTIAPLDLMIAAHALAIDATLVSADKALQRIAIVKIEDWSQ